MSVREVEYTVREQGAIKGFVAVGASRLDQNCVYSVFSTTKQSALDELTLKSGRYSYYPIDERTIRVFELT